MDESQARTLFARSRVATLATVTVDGLPHAVPVVFAITDDGTVVTAVDGKPKSTRHLRRLDNVRATGRVSLLADGYDEDWSRLWWVRVDGVADVVDASSPPGAEGIAALVAKYPQYRAARPDGPVIVVRPSRWASWTARQHDPGRAG